MNPSRRALQFSISSLALLLISGCALFSPKDPVSGNWSGDWYISALPKPGGVLKCNVTRVDKNQWKAEFEAFYGKSERALYKVELLGHREKEKVVFGGDVDLGAASGGVFHWTGQCDGKKFTGDYKSTNYTGRFELIPVAPSKEPPKS